LRHFVRAGEILGKRLLTLHNVTFYQTLLRKLRSAIRKEDPSELAAVRAWAAVATTSAAE
jgi:queuine tRNA-ribosyltransferase